MTKLEEQIRQITTYYSDDPLGGTAGYELSEEQYKQIMQAFEQAKS